jgi:hypothetical protein
MWKNPFCGDWGSFEIMLFLASIVRTFIHSVRPSMHSSVPPPPPAQRYSLNKLPYVYQCLKYGIYKRLCSYCCLFTFENNSLSTV